MRTTFFSTPCRSESLIVISAISSENGMKQLEWVEMEIVEMEWAQETGGREESVEQDEALPYA